MKDKLIIKGYDRKQVDMLYAKERAVGCCEAVDKAC